MNRVEYLADLSVGRACGFGAMGVVMSMLGLSADPLMCVRVGAFLTVVMGLVLALFAYRAPYRDYRRTELWVLLDKGRDLPPGYPAATLCQVLRETYTRYAELAGRMAIILCAVAAILAMFFFR